MRQLATGLGRMHVDILGSGDPVVLWHSLFLDSRSWCGLAEELAADRMVIVIDGPSHGRSEAVDRDFSFDDCADAAGQIIDQLGVSGPVDWVGNAWGGHVGIRLAARNPDRIRSLVTIGTPAHALRPGERWTKAWPLVQLYRLTGSNPILLKPLSDALVGVEASATVPDLATEVMSAFQAAPRRAMFHAIRSMMLRRPDMSEDLACITAPALLIAGRDDITGWRPVDAEAVAATMSHARVVGTAGSGHSSPLLIDRDTVTTALRGFWSDR